MENITTITDDRLETLQKRLNDIVEDRGVM
jgi:hypothetical protein